MRFGMQRCSQQPSAHNHAKIVNACYFIISVILTILVTVLCSIPITLAGIVKLLVPIPPSGDISLLSPIS